jgi:cycloeucalenol cycloisomerase
MAAQPHRKPAGGGAKRHPTGIFSDDPDKAWTERLILAQSPWWISAVAGVMVTGVIRNLSEASLMLLSITLTAPPVLLPILLSSTRPDRDLPWRQCYWLKLNTWVFIVVAFGTYFGTHYFFDLMGMRYAFDVQWTFEAQVVGQSGQVVPVFMYPLTHAYFMTYFVLLLVLERGMLREISKLQGRPAGWLGRALVVLALAYGLAFAETLFMANEFMTGLFAYEKHGRMLAVGSFGYAAYFVVGLPMVRRVDRGGRWTMGRVIIEALATCMGILMLLEVWAKMVGPL